MTKVAGNVHVAFGQSIAETLRMVLPTFACEERVLGLPGVLSIGPINPPDPGLRGAWAWSVLRLTPELWDEVEGDPSSAQTTRVEATGAGVAPVFWACLTNPMEHACFLAFASMMQNRPFDFIDATDLDFTTLGGVERPNSLGWMRPEDILKANLYARRRRLTAAEVEAATGAWLQLQHENAPFRVVVDDRLVSAPLTHYDAILIKYASRSWEVAGKLIARAFNALHSERSLRGQGNGADVLLARMLSLADEGGLQVRGLGPGLRDYEVRRR